MSRRGRSPGGAGSADVPWGSTTSCTSRACTTRALGVCPHLSKLAERPLRCASDEGRVIHRTDVTPGLEALAKTLPAGMEVVFSCYRLYGPEFTRRVIAAREDWDRLTRSRRKAAT